LLFLKWVLKAGSLVAFMELSIAAVDKTMAVAIINTGKLVALVSLGGVACKNHHLF
jgi:hypothetical protein